MKLKNCLPFLIFPLLVSCSPRPAERTIDAETYKSYLAAGNEISAATQAALLSHVSQAMQEGGSVYAVEFCNHRAAGITDSLSLKWDCEISRISEKNRNPENGLATDADKALWEYFLARHREGIIHDTVILAGGHPVYYRPLVVAMPACLQCHGQVQDIEAATYQKIQELYPSDLATGYQLNDFRGLWKILFKADYAD